MKSIIIYHLETKLHVPMDDEETFEGIEYCKSDTDFDRMGISCLGLARIDLDFTGITAIFAHIWDTNARSTLADIGSSPSVLLGGWQTPQHEDKLLFKNGLNIKSEFDILDLIRKAKGYNERTFDHTMQFYSRIALAEENNIDLYLDEKQGAYYHQNGMITELLDVCTRNTLAEATILYLLLEGTLREPLSKNLLTYKFPEESINLGYG